MSIQYDFTSLIHLNIGGKKFCTTVETLTQREPDSMLAAMFSGSHILTKDPHTARPSPFFHLIFVFVSFLLNLVSCDGFVFVDRDGKHFRHILNWLRDGVIPTLNDSEYPELLREAEYYQLIVMLFLPQTNFTFLSQYWSANFNNLLSKFFLLRCILVETLGLIEGINAVLNEKKEDDVQETELTRTDIIKCIQSEKVRFRGVNLSGLDLSKLDLSFVDFSYACLKNVFFSRANLQCAKFRDVDAEGSIFHNAILRECEFTGANLRGALLAGASLQSANLQDASLIGCSFCGADLRSAHLQSADLTDANLEGANLEGANLKGAKLTNANLRGANLQRAYLRHVNLRETQLDGAKLDGANLLGAIR
ncbi:Potassium channel tetramerization-type BTB domain [Dillenia turbinata]|uniref:Potassium channel tetramerization-type BTB domain n=1 Tax=Dillenia turbinata TaxID=194707 RepID=A0AAN8W1C3_9MAGN